MELVEGEDLLIAYPAFQLVQIVLLLDRRNEMVGAVSS
jgi:hypothetical protein